MARTVQPIEVEQIPDNDRSWKGDLIERHPAFATIQASRVQGHMGAMFGSDLSHDRYICIRLRTSEVHVDLRTGINRIHSPLAEFVEVALTENQWASFVSSLNMGEGVPCTITSRDWQHVPAIPEKVFGEQNKEAIAKMSGESLESVREALKAIDDLLTDKKITKSAAAQLTSPLNHAIQTLKHNLPFVVQIAKERVDSMTTEAKAAVEGHMLSIVVSAGLDSLRSQIDAPQLPSSQTKEITNGE